MRWMGKPTPQAPEEIMRVRTEQKTITGVLRVDSVRVCVCEG